MRMLLNVKFPNAEFSNSVRDGSAGQKIGQILEELKPEAVYFTEQHGQRSALLIVDVDDSSKIPMIAEPFFLTFNANVELEIVMSPEDLKKAGLEELGRKWRF
ncbi:panthothenate synthetase [Glaciimonas sp. CA11.2]|uniref:panthothenate synthetase n=1 Tax=Glaciimonas sp. CA11.2 TaxID=3048601 RepID=UPI002AB5C464|nr:panthothenate synthetase [Glaciimonas sp. CA11.2]MDY7545111.1 panthothenate synthetase [Glaciimonas sp. CA11.2]